MSPLRNIIISLLMLSAGVATAATSSSSDSNDREILAVHVKRSHKSSKKSKRGSKKHKEKSFPDANAAVKPQDVQRVALQVRTTLVNFEIDHESLTDPECIFFEDAWMDAFDLIYGDFATARSMIVENQEQRRRGRNLLRSAADGASNGGDGAAAASFAAAGQEERSLFLYSSFGLGNNWFDIFGLIEYKCTFCSHDRGYDDDDDAGIYYFGGNRKLSNGSEEKQHFEKLFCDMLHQGPFEAFLQVEECQVTFTV